MSACPFYYRLSSDREFAEFSQQELDAWLSHRVSPAVYHAVISAMEHRFRAGLKDGELETDRQAEKYWMGVAEKLFDDDFDRHDGRYEFWDIADVVIAMVDFERKSKDSQIAFQLMVERTARKHAAKDENE